MKKFLAVALVVLAALSLASSAHASTPGQRNALSSAQSYLARGRSPSPASSSSSSSSTSPARTRAGRSPTFGSAGTPQAVESAKSYLRRSSFSRQGLIEQLEFEGFTPSQAAYGVTKAYR